MGNSLAADLRREHDLVNVEKELHYLDVGHNNRKKKSIIFNSNTWKRIVESTRRRGSKVKINLSYTDGNISSKPKHSEIPTTVSTTGNSKVAKSQSCYVINSKTMPPVTAIGGKNGLTTTLLQQPKNEEKVKSVATDPIIPINNTEYDRMLAKEREALGPKTINEKSINDISNLKISGTYNNRQSRVNNETKQDKKSAQQVTAKPQSKPSNGAPRKVVIQASTSELLMCLGEFICYRCRNFPELEPSTVTNWLRGVDRSLLMQGWQDISFIMPSSVVFVYMLCKEMITENMNSLFEIQATVLTCLYMSYSYMGNEISYPLRPFMIEQDRFAFWSRCCKIMDKLSGKMLRINKEAQYFTSVFRELKMHGTRSVHSTQPVRPAPLPSYQHVQRNSVPVNRHYSHMATHPNNMHSGGVRIAMTAGAGR